MKEFSLLELIEVSTLEKRILNLKVQDDFLFAQIRLILLYFYLNKPSFSIENSLHDSNLFSFINSEIECKYILILKKFYEKLNEIYCKSILNQDEKINFFIQINEAKNKNNFSYIKSLSKLCFFSLNKKKEDIEKFFNFYCQKRYGIPNQTLNKIIEIIKKKWIATSIGIEVVNLKYYSLAELNSIVFQDSDLSYGVVFIDNLDRLFSLCINQYYYLFLPRLEKFNILDSCKIVHELNHIKENLEEDRSVKLKEKNIFQKEKNAILSELEFLRWAKAGKLDFYCFFESNLLYPLIFLEWELDKYLKDEYNVENFNAYCMEHKMRNIKLTFLHDWGEPFQIIVYAAALIEISDDWQNFIKL